ncbi:alanyl-tRNA ligase [endosymbiont of Acanthamoeba sp. UWC8]|uniref:alanine--tRNA ligase n=1 Tax=endosymbiont of Acanthamoeba sp. UWC8 TaxID=86106 RepID=UPI0004D107A6|nr:alanine--tRNA ligase [endosymbiont of Acanthamoeba sp. UWC8]AIF80729.1 alanyl-tRNA ligase [endosymbiont of Acanthamoeba sp. UWC8]
MQVNQVRKSFLEYFEKNDHKIIPSGSLVPRNDPSLMFTSAGMVPFKNYFTGTEVAINKRVSTAQKCVRAGGKHNDLENVGYTARHHTFFEMLGNFSFGDYFKDEAILLAWNYLTKEVGLNTDKLYITIYHDDEEAYKIWKKITGFSDQKIIRIATSDNFWSMGDTGPCGPCSEIFYDHGDKYWGGLPGSAEADGDRFVEIWNLVFMQYEQLADGSRIALPKPCIDTGMGLERISAVLQGTNHNYETDLFKSLIKASEQISGNNENITSHRVIADHLRSSAFLIADGILPSNEGRGYVLRRIMRRAMRHIHILGAKEPLMHKLVHTLVNEMGEAYPELKRAEAVITTTLNLEELKFRETLDRGLKLLNTNIENLNAGEELKGEIAFKLYDTYGFPLDLTKDILRSKQIMVGEAGFEQEMEAQRSRARAAWVGSGEKATDEVWFNIHETSGATEFLGYASDEAEAIVKAIIVDGKLVEQASGGEAIIVLNQTPFYAESGGQVGDTGFIDRHMVTDTKKYASHIFGHITVLSGEVKCGDIVHAKIDVERRERIRANHSATHLLHKILRESLGEHVTQKGSLVTAEKLRFDFSHAQALNKEQIRKIEKEVNRMVIKNHEVLTELSSMDKAIEKGAMALFGEKYGEEVRTIGMGESLELCGGTHVARTGDIGLFKVVSEEAIAAGVRRIEAVTALDALEYVTSKEEIIKDTAGMLKCSEGDIHARVESLIEEKRKAEKEISSLRITLALSSEVTSEMLGNINFTVKKLINIAPQELKNIALEVQKQVKEGVILLTTIYEERVSIMVLVSLGLQAKYKAGDIIKEVLTAIEGKGGGKADMAQAGGTRISGIDQAIEQVRKFILQLK